MDVQGMRRFVKNSNVEIRTDSNSNSNNNNNNFARELESVMEVESNKLNKYLKEKNTTEYGNFAQFLDDEEFVVSALKPGMFNVTVNKNFDKEARLDLKKILRKPIRPAGILVGNIKIQVTEIRGLYGRFQTGFRKDAQGSQGNIDGFQFSAVDFKARVFDSREEKGISFTVYRNGKIRYSGGFLGINNITKQPDAIKKYIVDNYTDGQFFLYNPAFYNNISGQFKVNAKFRSLKRIVSPLAVAQYGIEPTSSYEPELSPIVYVDYKGFNYNITENGIIQILGISNPDDLIEAYEKGSQLMKKFNKGGEFLSTGLLHKPAKRAVKGKKSTCPKLRIPPCKTGFSARKNPQGFDCCYKIPKKTPKRKAAPVTPPAKKYNVAMTNKQELKINGILCRRLPKEVVIKTARDMGIVGISKKNTIAEICKMISMVQRVNPVVNSIKVGNKNMKVTGKNNTFRLSNRICKTYKKEKLKQIVDALKIKRTNKETVPELCRMIEKYKPMQNLRKKIINAYGAAWINKYKPSINSDVKELSNKIATTNVLNVDQLIKRTVAAKKRAMRPRPPPVPKRTTPNRKPSPPKKKNSPNKKKVSPPKKKTSPTKFPKGTKVEYL
tara:strand:+ start:573 stop:2402 length:1830 start_codon:yes stop_codon:yes gene_type:complete